MKSHGEFTSPNKENVESGDKLVKIVLGSINIFPVDRAEEMRLYYQEMGNNKGSIRYEDAIIRKKDGQFLVGDNVRSAYVTKRNNIERILSSLDNRKA